MSEADPAIPERSQEGREGLHNPSRNPKVCVLLASFVGAKRASNVRRQMGKAIRADGSTILDEAVLVVGTARKARVYDPHRVLMGALTSALTWGLFGLLAGGLQGLGVWGVLGALCGGGYAYLTEHLLTKDELKQIGERLPVDSSAIAVFVQGSDPERMLSSVAPHGAVTASIAAIAPDLTAEVYSDESQLGGASGSTGAASPSSETTELSMLLVRFAGEHGAQQALAGSNAAKRPDPTGPQVEIVVQANEEGRRRVVAPVTGTATTAKSDVVSWGAFGLVWGAIVGLAGDGGVLGSVESGLLVGVACAIFGLGAGALYGLWAGRAVSARRLRRIGAFVDPDTSMMVAWAGETATRDAIERWAASGSERLILRFNPVGRGVLLDV